MSTDRELNREKILTIFEEYCHDSSAHRLEVAVNKHLDLLTEATHEAEAEALKKGLDLANRIDGCHGCMGLSEGMSEEYQKLEKRLANLRRTKNKEEGENDD